ncbi:alpha/beta hydrolase [Staphylococcus auricularis]|uniref:alpha/beta hydrolase n=1 Tax=Staphylococcus auricularis TaxID=29379 RepID=UPI003EBE1C83
MINVKQPNPIFLEGELSDHAVLLLHSFTGTVRDVKLLANKLNKAGFTCYVPPYKGHGLKLTELMQYDINDWWDDAKAAYQWLKDKGYSHISVMGVSLGGILALRLAENVDIETVLVMSTPYRKDVAGLTDRLTYYGQKMGDLMGMSESEIEDAIAQIKDYEPGLNQFKVMTEDTMDHLDQIKAPVAIKYGKQDEPVYEKSAQFIYDNINHEDKELQGYTDCKHLMTQGKGHAEVEADAIAFLEDYR